MKEKIIYDLGANNGQNLSYYLSKADKVVAVEANPILSKEIEEIFADEIKGGKLIVVNLCLTIENNIELVSFFIHKFHSVWSTFVVPQKNFQDYEEIKVGIITYQELLEKYGEPYYVKIDLEGFDVLLIKYMIEHNLLPRYFSFENNGIQLLKEILETGIYSRFNIVSFYNFYEIYPDWESQLNSRSGNYMSKILLKASHSAGPMGEDIKSPWLSEEKIIELYMKVPNSWFDIHVSKERISLSDLSYEFYQEKKNFTIQLKRLLPIGLKKWLKNKLHLSN